MPKDKASISPHQDSAPQLVCSHGRPCRQDEQKSYTTEEDLHKLKRREAYLRGAREPSADEGVLWRVLSALLLVERACDVDAEEGPVTSGKDCPQSLPAGGDAAR